jgi:hypothetical protein
MARNEALQDINLRDGEEFGEDTALAYDSDSGYAAVQYNHYGPRERSIEDYLYAFDLSIGGLRAGRPGERDEDRCGFKFGALLKRDAYARLRRFGIIHDIEFTVARPGVMRDDLAAGRSLGQILRVPLPEGVETLSVTIKAAPGNAGSLGRDRALGIVDDLRRLGADLTHAVVRGKPTREDPFEKVDLVEERISSDPPIALGRGRRYSRPDRWAALAHTLRDWLDGGALRN